MPVSLRTIAPAEADIRLDRWFHRHYPNLTQGALQKMLRTGQVRLDGARVEANARLKPGQQLRIPPLPEAAAAMGLPCKTLRGLIASGRVTPTHRDGKRTFLRPAHGLAQLSRGGLK